MLKALVIGAGRIGAGFRWHDDAYTHAGAYRAHRNRAQLVGFVEPNPERADAAEKKWGVTAYEALEEGLTSANPDIVSICSQPEQQEEIFAALTTLPWKRGGVWCEKPFVSSVHIVPTQVNYMRRGDMFHRDVAKSKRGGKLIVYGKDDLTTRCHFEDLASWWGAELDYRPFQGPCAYVYEKGGRAEWFDNGGVDAGLCFRNMLGNLLDHIEFGTPLWSPAHAS